MWHQGGWASLRRFVAGLVAFGLIGAALPAAASATTPQSTATCSGSLSPDSSGPSSGEPNALNYTFNCSADITNYTFVVTRRANNQNTIDDYEGSPVVLQPDGTASSSQTFTCSGAQPGDGFNCNAPTGTPMTAGNSANGFLDPVDPYCKHLPPGAAPGTPAEPQAQVEVIVTDSTGAIDGPFTLSPTSACPAVPNTVPYPPPPKPKPTHSCAGSLRHDGSGGSRQPNLVDYTFRCDGEVSAYSIIASRQSYPHKTIGSFGSSPLVLQPGGAPSPTESFSCSGRVPGAGFNCVAPAGSPLTAKNSVTSSFNLIDPYCKRLPPGGKPGTPAEPQAQVELLITDATGAQRGPFSLDIKPACAQVPSRVPHPDRTTHHRTGRKHAYRRR